MQHIKRIKEKNHMFLSVEREKAFNKIQKGLYNKSLKKLRTEHT
jgi:hypothetical protein